MSALLSKNNTDSYASTLSFIIGRFDCRQHSIPRQMVIFIYHNSCFMSLTSNKRIPVVQYLQLIVFGGIILYLGRVLLIPMSYGLLIAIVLYPLCKKLESKGWPRSLAIAACLLVVIILFALLVTLLMMEIDQLVGDLPELATRMKPALLSLQQWIENNLGINIGQQRDWLINSMRNFGGNGPSLIRETLSQTSGTLFVLFMAPVFSSLFLYNRSVFVKFLEKVCGKKYEPRLHSILRQTINTYFRFIKGMLMVYLIVGILNSAGLLALGIDHAILFGMLTAIMTIIPYVGIMISALLPISVAWITKDSAWYPLGVVAVFTFVQYLEANLIFPKVVASQLKVSTWSTLVAVISGGIIWGVSGMILFIPFAGILKIITDSTEGQEPLAILLSRE